MLFMCESEHLLKFRMYEVTFLHLMTEDPSADTKCTQLSNPCSDSKWSVLEFYEIWIMTVLSLNNVKNELALV